jgi:hypothetical protein
MKKWVFAAAVASVWLAGASPAAANEASAPRVATPPPRPLPITGVQFQAMDRLSREPQHAQAATVRAAYSPEADRKMQQIGVHVTQAILPATVLTLLIMAAPL